jgi:hypothetical protein
VKGKMTVSQTLLLFFNVTWPKQGREHANEWGGRKLESFEQEMG